MNIFTQIYLNINCPINDQYVTDRDIDFSDHQIITKNTLIQIYQASYIVLRCCYDAKVPCNSCQLLLNIFEQWIGFLEKYNYDVLWKYLLTHII